MLHVVTMTIPKSDAPLLDLGFELLDLNPSRTELTREDCVSYQFFHEAEAEAVLAQAGLRAHLADWGLASRCSIETEVMEDEDWADSWKRFFSFEIVSPRLAVKPSWIDVASVAGRHDLLIDPGLSFGTGQHFTTKTCLQCIDRLLTAERAPCRFLDVGCGSGILSIAAATLGAAPVVGIDIDPTSIEVAQQNAANNGVADRVVYRQGDDAAVREAGRFDLVVANIFADVLIAMCPAICEALRDDPDARLVMSGILATQAEGVVSAYAGKRVVEESRLCDDEWVTLVCRRASA